MTPSRSSRSAPDSAQGSAHVHGEKPPQAKNLVPLKALSDVFVTKHLAWNLEGKCGVFTFFVFFWGVLVWLIVVSSENGWQNVGRIKFEAMELPRV